MVRDALRSLVVLSLVLGACGGDDDDSSAEDITVDDRSADELAADTAAAEGALLVLDDLPDGWTSEPNEETGERDEALDECLGGSALTDALDTDEGHADSDEFSQEDLSAASDVTVLPRDAAAEALMDVLLDPKAADCLRESTVAGLAEEGGETPEEALEYGDVDVERLELPDLADQAVGFRITTRADFFGDSLFFVIDFVLIRGGRSIASVLLTNVVQGGEAAPFDEDLGAELTQLVADRVGAI